MSENINQGDITFLPVLNQAERQSSFPLNFTVCLTTMFNNYNNVLQFIQASDSSMYIILYIKLHGIALFLLSDVIFPLCSHVALAILCLS